LLIYGTLDYGDPLKKFCVSFLTWMARIQRIFVVSAHLYAADHSMWPLPRSITTGATDLGVAPGIVRLF